MNIYDLGAAISALRVTLTDYGIDEATQEDLVSRFSKRLVEEELAVARELSQRFHKGAAHVADH